MSRSHKKFPHWADNGRSVRYWKRLASKAARRATGLQDGSSYKREYCSWNIRDWKYTDFSQSWKEREKWWQSYCK